MTSAVAVNG